MVEQHHGKRLIAKRVQRLHRTQAVKVVHAVSINTIRSQLRVIFSKTNTAGQVELVSVLAGLPMAALGLGAV